MESQYGGELIGITYIEDGSEAMAIFANGKSVTGSVVVGTNGPQSKVRQLLFGPERGGVCSMDMVHSNVPIVNHDAKKARFVRNAHPVFSCMAHPNFKSISFIASTSSTRNFQCNMLTRL